MILAAVTQVAQPVAQAAPVIQTVVQNVPVTPDYIKELLSLLLLIGSGFGASIAHQLIQGARNWKFGVNLGLLFLYSILLAALDLYLQGALSFSWGSAPELANAFLVVFGAASIRYKTYQAMQRRTESKTLLPINATP